eukprot:g13582.t1
MRVSRKFSTLVRDHYSGTNSGKAAQLIEKIERGLKGKVSVDGLGPVDEFHIGGRLATINLMDQIGIRSNDNVLDLGCGLGGAARFAAANYGCNVHGIDLTPEFVDVGNYLNTKLGLDDRVTLSHGNVLNLKSLSSNIKEYDHAYMMHVGMNIKDKKLLFQEASSKLRKGAKFGIYDIMYFDSETKLDFPVPWASSMETSACSTIDFYQDSLEAAGLEIIAVNNRHKFAIEFFDRVRKLQSQEDYSPPSLGLHLIMDSFQEKMKNMIANVNEERIAPIEVIAVKT